MSFALVIVYDNKHFRPSLDDAICAQSSIPSRRRLYNRRLTQVEIGSSRLDWRSRVLLGFHLLSRAIDRTAVYVYLSKG